MKYFVFGDVHGFYDQFMMSLKESGFDENNPTHMLISLGDNFDRGPKNYEMFEFLKEMNYKKKIILIRGNHEDLILKMITRRSSIDVDDLNGTTDTIKEFSKKYFDCNDMFIKNTSMIYDELKKDGFFDLIYEMKDYFETEHFIFTHGFIPIIEDRATGFYKYKKDWRNASFVEIERSRWINGIAASEYFKIKEEGKKIVVGHWNCSYGNVRKKYGFNLPYNTLRSLEFSELDFSKPYYGENIIAIDGCTARTHIVNVIVVDD